LTPDENSFIAQAVKTPLSYPWPASGSNEFMFRIRTPLPGQVWFASSSIQLIQGACPVANWGEKKVTASQKMMDCGSGCWENVGVEGQLASLKCRTGLSAEVQNQSRGAGCHPQTACRRVQSQTKHSSLRHVGPGAITAYRNCS